MCRYHYRGKLENIRTSFRVAVEESQPRRGRGPRVHCSLALLSRVTSLDCGVAKESCKREYERILTGDYLEALKGFAAGAGALRLQSAFALPGESLKAARPHDVFPFRPSPPDSPLSRAEERGAPCAA